MVISERELTRLANDQYLDRKITLSVHCGQCGYNLKTLPYAGRCTECGAEYNARPLTMKGIFNVQDAFIPYSSILLSLVCAASALALLWSTGWSPHPISLILAICLAWFAIFNAWESYTGITRFMRAISIWKRIRKEEGD